VAGRKWQCGWKRWRSPCSSVLSSSLCLPSRVPCQPLPRLTSGSEPGLLNAPNYVPSHPARTPQFTNSKNTKMVFKKAQKCFLLSWVLGFSTEVVLVVLRNNLLSAGGLIQLSFVPFSGLPGGARWWVRISEFDGQLFPGQGFWEQLSAVEGSCPASCFRLPGLPVWHQTPHCNKA